MKKKKVHYLQYEISKSCCGVCYNLVSDGDFYLDLPAKTKMGNLKKLIIDHMKSANLCDHDKIYAIKIYESHLECEVNIDIKKDEEIMIIDRKIYVFSYV